MTVAVKNIVEMLDMLPEVEQDFACEVLKKIVLAWDSEFTKLTPFEKQRLEKSKNEIKSGEYFVHDEIDWDNLDNLILF